jgi:hypothetical protein
MSASFVYPNDEALPPNAVCPTVPEWTANELAQMRGRLLVLGLLTFLGAVGLTWVFALPSDVRVLGLLTAAAVLLLLTSTIVLVTPGEGARISYFAVVLIWILLWLAALILAIIRVVRARRKREGRAARIAALSVSGALFVFAVAFFVVFLSPKARQPWR